jgi:hypothetical protein
LPVWLSYGKVGKIQDIGQSEVCRWHASTCLCKGYGRCKRVCPRWTPVCAGGKKGDTSTIAPVFEQTRLGVFLRFCSNDVQANQGI